MLIVQHRLGHRHSSVGLRGVCGCWHPPTVRATRKVERDQSELWQPEPRWRSCSSHSLTVRSSSSRGKAIDTTPVDHQSEEPPETQQSRAGPCTTVAAASFHLLTGCAAHAREAEDRGHPGNRGSPGPPPGRQLQLASAHNRCSEHRARVLGRASRRPSESNEPGTSVPPDYREPDLTLTEEDVTQTPSGCDDERHPATGRAA